jgi:hypothetical protein
MEYGKYIKYRKYRKYKKYIINTKRLIIKRKLINWIIKLIKIVKLGKLINRYRN